MERAYRLGKPYKMRDNYKLIDDMIIRGYATRDDYFVADDMDDFRIRHGVNEDEDLKYCLIVFEGTRYEFAIWNMAPWQTWDKIQEILSDLGNIG